jgi:hypothetical protein
MSIITTRILDPNSEEERDDLLASPTLNEGKKTKRSTATEPPDIDGLIESLKKEQNKNE